MGDIWLNIIFGFSTLFFAICAVSGSIAILKILFNWLIGEDNDC